MQLPNLSPDELLETPYFCLLGTGKACCIPRPGADPVELKHNDGPLLALLLLDGTQPRSKLCTLFWPDSPPHQRSSSLSQRGIRLKAQVGVPVIDTRGSAISLHSGLSWDVKPIASLSDDALLATPGLLAGNDPGPLEELSSWLEQAREKVADLLVEELIVRAAALERASDLRSALEMARKAVSLNKFSEASWYQQMRLQYLMGDRAAALELYWRMDRLWRDEYSAPPSEEVQELYQTLIVESLPSGKRRMLPVSVLRPPVLIGRRTAWASMSAAWECAQPFLLLGEAGIGKSRLLEEYLRGEEGVVRVDALPADKFVPYALLGRLLLEIERRFVPTCTPEVRAELARIRPELGTASTLPVNGALLNLALVNWFSAATTEGLRAIVVDDLHDADEASLEVLRRLSGVAALADLRMGFAARPMATDGKSSVVAAWLVDSRRPVQINLTPMSRQELLELLTSMMLSEAIDTRVVERLYRHAGGHPLYTLAVLQHSMVNGVSLDDGASLTIPDSVQTLLDARILELPQDARRLVQVLSVGGQDLSVDRAAQIIGCPALELSDAWATLEAANVLCGEAFTHGLVHEAALRRVALGTRQSLHRKWAAVLAADGTAQPARIAMHWEAGLRTTEAGAAWHAAGVAARRMGRLTEQADFFERAARCSLASGDREAAFESLFTRLEGLQLRHGGAVVISAMDDVRALADTSLQRLRCRIAATEALLALGPAEAARAVEEAGAATREAIAHPDQLIAAQALLGIALAQCHRHEEALPVAGIAMEGARASGQPAKILQAANGLMYVHWAAGRLAEALAAQREELDCAERLGDLTVMAASQGSMAALLASAGDVPGTYFHATHAGLRQRQTGLDENSPQFILNHTVLGAAAAALGQYDEAIDNLEHAVRLAGPQAAADVHGKACVTLAGVWLCLGRPDRCLEVGRQVSTQAPPGIQMQASWLMARASEQDGAGADRHWTRFDRLLADHRELPLTQGVAFEASYREATLDSVGQLAVAKAACEQLGLQGLARTLAWRWLIQQMELSKGRASDEAMDTCARDLELHVAQGLSAKAYRPEVWLTLSKFFAGRGDLLRSQACRDLARRWIAAASERMNPDWRHAFGRRNPVNVVLTHD